MPTEPTGKKTYTPPQLIVYGTVAKITADGAKWWGAGDGYTFMGVPIHTLS